MSRRALLLVLPALLGTDWGWNGGLAPLDLAEAPDAASCGRCHTQQHTQWSASNHKNSWHNDLLLVGYAAEPLDFCVHCHAPRPQQKAEILANRDFYRSLDPRSGIPIGSVDRLPEPHASEGVDCAACHWRDGEILSESRSFAAPHRVTEAPELGTGEVCAGCHDFPMPTTVDGRLALTDVPMQSTTAEWRAWQDRGGQQSCAECHMPGGDHRVRGAHDRDFLRGAWSVNPARDAKGLRFELRSVGVGHHLPTGDLFRHATLEVQADDGWTEIARFGRTFTTTVDPAEGLPHKTLASDTSLRPDEVRVVRADDPGGTVRWRMRWHDGSPIDEARGLLDLDAITYVVASGTLAEVP